MYINKTKCPHCYKTLDWEVNGSKDDPLGEHKFFLCRFCKMKISNGRSEWEEKTRFEKSHYIYRILLTIIVNSIATVLFSAFAVVLFTSSFEAGDYIFKEPYFTSINVITYSVIATILVSLRVLKRFKVDIEESKARLQMKKNNC